MYDDDDDRMWLRVTRLRGKGVEFGAAGMVLQGHKLRLEVVCSCMQPCGFCVMISRSLLFCTLHSRFFISIAPLMQVLLLPREARVV
jgi:hypothetical protein